MRRKSIIITFVLLGSFFAGCGGSSFATAPPVDLPAPVVGRITIGTPDATGKATIIGTEGAVEPGSIILAVNTRIEGSVSTLWKLTDVLIPAAYAQTAATCTALGHVCTIANEDGSFSMSIDAVIGDTIYVVLIDENGVEISPRVTFTIPSTELIQELNACTGLGLTGTMAGLVNIEGNPMTLYQGTDTESNKIEVGPFPISLPGCYARDLTLIPGTAGNKLVMISKEDMFMWVSTLDQLALTSGDTFELTEAPLTSAFIGEADTVAVAVATAAGFAVQKLSLTDGSVLVSIAIPEPLTPAGYALTEVVSMKAFGPFGDGRFLITVLTRGQGAGSDVFYLSFFDSTDLENIASGDENLNLTTLLGSNFFTDDLSDIEFYPSPSVFGSSIIITNHAEGVVHSRRLVSGGVIFSQDELLSLYRNITIDTAFLGNYDIESSFVLGVTALPKKIAHGFNDVNERILYILTDGLDFWKMAGLMDPSIINGYNSVATLEGNNQADFIAIDNVTPDTSILIGDDSLKQVFDFGSFWVHTLP